MRLQVELSEEFAQDIEVLMEESGFSTKKELFNNALTLFQWAFKERKAGRIIASVDEKQQKYKELVMPALAAVSK